MTKRQKRISGDEIPKELLKTPDQPVSLILRSGQVYYFRIMKINEFSLEVADMRNIRKEINFENIDEIILDI